MKKISYSLLASLLTICVLISCDEFGTETFKPQTFDVQGKVEKGPFISGSDISIQPMDADLQVIGSLLDRKSVV